MLDRLHLRIYYNYGNILSNKLVKYYSMDNTECLKNTRESGSLDSKSDVRRRQLALSAQTARTGVLAGGTLSVLYRV